MLRSMSVYDVLSVTHCSLPHGAAPACCGAEGAGGRGLHPSTFRLNLSAFYGKGGARRGCEARFKGVCRVCRVFLCVRHGSS